MSAAGFAGRGLLALLAAVVLGCGGVDEDTAVVEGADEPDPDAGRRMYREGVLPSGQPLTAIVAGDVPVLGTQFSCQSCHGRSGMGASEGAYIVPSVAAQFLFVESPQPKRPAYNTESLARVLRDGVTPSGRTLSQELMPRYRLEDDELALLVAYLATLSPGNSPGVDDKVIRFATVITEGVNPTEREAVLAVLDKFFAEINRQTRNESERLDRGSTPASRLPTVHRDWVLEEWALAGPSETWNEQLEQRYRDGPVFAMLSGLSHSSWGPISRFCERNEIPCLFPGTDLADAAKDDFYTLYYSRGLELEADLIANHLAAQPLSNVIQVYCEGAPAQVAAGLRTTLEKVEVLVRDFEFDCEDAPPVEDLAEFMTSTRDAAVILWLGREQTAAVSDSLQADRVYLSSTLLDGELDGAFLSVSGSAFIAHPFRLPGQSDPALSRFKVWAKTRGIELASPRRQSEAFFACLAMKEAIAHIGRFFIRDFALDGLDHAQSLVAYLPYYPRPTLGPRQRFVNKGGYVLPIVDGRPDTKGAAWILP